MVCDRVSIKSAVQTVFFFGYMIGSLVFGYLSDKFVNEIIEKNNERNIFHLYLDLADDRSWAYRLSLFL